MSPRAVALSLALVGTLDGPANDNWRRFARAPWLPTQLQSRSGKQHPRVHPVFAGEPGGRENGGHSQLLPSATELQAHVVGPRGIEPPDLPRIASDARTLCL